MKPTDPWFYQDRAIAFAGLVLTQHGNVLIKPYAGQDLAVDLLVEILKNRKSTLRFFGVQIIADMDLPTVEEAEKRVLAHLDHNASEAALPLGVFAVGIRKPEGIYRWNVEPVVEDGRPLLRPNTRADWKPLDGEAAARLIAQVNLWYDALHEAQDPVPPGRHVRTSS